MVTTPPPSVQNSIADLNNRMAKIENWLKIAAGTATIFGVVGGFGWQAIAAIKSDIDKQKNAVATAKDEINDFTAKQKKILVAQIEALVEESMKNHEVGGKIITFQNRLNRIGTGPGNVKSGNPLAPIATSMVGTCPSGSVATGITLNMGGTCNHQCDNDGRPIVQMELSCVSL